MGGKDKRGTRHRMAVGPETAGKHPTAKAKGANGEKTERERKQRGKRGE